MPGSSTVVRQVQSEAAKQVFSEKTVEKCKQFSSIKPVKVLKRSSAVKQVEIPRQLSAWEQLRLNNIKEQQELLEKLGFFKPKPVKLVKCKRPRIVKCTLPVRRSARNLAKL